MNERMDFTDFANAAAEQIKDYLPERFAGAQVQVSPFEKLNTSYLGMQVKTPDQTVVPNINLSAVYEQYMDNDMSFDSVMRTIAEQVQMTPDMTTEWLKDYSQVKDHLYIRVSDAKENEAYLSGIPHQETDGLAVSCHISIQGPRGMDASTAVTYQMMEMYGVPQEQLFADAMESSQNLLPAKFSSMAQIMQEMMGLDPDMAAEMMPPSAGPQLMVLTNDRSVQGAGALFYPGQLEAIADQVGSDFFVLPSSIHEVLIYADDGSTDLDALQGMVREINQTTVAPEDRLSDFVYHYDTRDQVLEKAETFAARMAEKEQEAEMAAPDKAEGARSDEPGRGNDDRKASARDEEKREDGGKERRSVLGKLSEKKEQVKTQPKKTTPARNQEAAI